MARIPEEEIERLKKRSWCRAWPKRGAWCLSPTEKTSSDFALFTRTGSLAL
jgi:hypothetical protein